MDFRVTLEQTGEVERNINIEIPRNIYDSRFDSALNRAVSRVQIKGFRQGRAPRAMVAKMYGGSIQEDVLNDLIRTAFQDAVKEHSLKVVGSPRVNVEPIEADKDVKISAGVSVLPEPTIKDYMGLSFKVHKHELTESDIDKEIDNLRESYANTETVSDRQTVENGDLVRINYIGTIDEKPVDGGKGDGVIVELGSGRVPPEIDEGLLGLSVGEEKTIEVKLPDDVRDEAARGKSASYQVTVTEILKKILPEVNDEFAKLSKLGDDVAAMRAHIRKHAEDRVTKQNEQERENKLYEALGKVNSFEVPQVMIDEEIRNIMFESGILDRKKEEHYRVDMAPFRDHFSAGAGDRVRRAIMLERIIEQEGMEVSDAEVDSWLDERATEGKADRQMIDKMFGYPGNSGRIKAVIARKKMLAKLIENANIQEYCDHSHEAEDAEGTDEKKAPKKAAKKSKGK